MTLRVSLYMEITSQKSLCTSHTALFSAFLLFGHLGSTGSWHFTRLGPVLTGVHDCDMLMDDRGPGVGWSIRPDPVPVTAGAQVCSDFRERAVGLRCRQWELWTFEEGISGCDHCLISMAFILSISYVNLLQALFFLVLVIYWSELTTSERSWLPHILTTSPLRSSQMIWCRLWWCLELCMVLDPCIFWWVFVSLCSICGQVEHSRVCSHVRGVGESGNSKSIITQVQFRTGQTEALLTVSIVRGHADIASPSVPLFSAKWLHRLNLYTVSEKWREVRKNNHFNVTKTRRDGVIKQLANCHNTRESNNNMTIWRHSSWWSL